MAKSELRLKAREMRAKGMSVREIAQQLHVSKSTASLWGRDIVLTIEQLEQLRQQNIKGGERGRLAGALKQKNERIARIRKGVENGKNVFSHVTQRELLIAGVALYWAEGTKKKRVVAFCNSDPNLVQFMLDWLRICFTVSINQLSCYVGINEAHKTRENEVMTYWSNLTKIPLSQFTKTSFKRVKNAKVYENFSHHYGTLTVKVKKPAQMHYDVLGLIEGLYSAKKARVAQW